MFGAGGMILYAGVLALIPAYLTALFVAPGAPVAGNVSIITVTLLPVVAICLAADCGRIVLVGVLRGLGDTRRPVTLNLAGFWLVALPLATVLGLGTSLGVTGIWFGMAVGMGVISILLARRLTQA